MHTIIRKGESMAEKCAETLVDNGPEWDEFGEHIADAEVSAVLADDSEWSHTYGRCGGPAGRCALVRQVESARI